MVCTATSTATSTACESFEEPALSRPAWASSCKVGSGSLRPRRRHSSYQPQTWSIDTDDIQVLVDRFLAELGKRLEFFEEFGQFKVDSGVSRAYETLRTVHDSCTRVSDEMIDAGWRRARVLVETLEEGYRDALARKQTMEAKAREGVRLMETTLRDFETRAYELHNTGLTQVASDFLSSGKNYLDDGATRAVELMDEGIEKARQAKEALKARVEYALNRAREHGLIAYADLPEPWRVNPHILSGYRFNPTAASCVKSCFTSFSNETVNIYSHGLGLVLLLTIAFYFYPSHEHFALHTKTDIFIAAMFFFAAAKCLFCSTMWHTMSSISSQTLLERFACVDYTGIALLVAASIMTTEYTAFYCEPVSRWTYMTLTFVLGIMGTIAPWHPTFNRADMQWLRVGFFVSLAATGAIPIIQLVYTRGPSAIYFYTPILRSLAVYLGGACLYAAKLPERWFPGAFDYVGGSHNIWHIAVLGGILFHYDAMKVFFAEALRRGQSGCSVY